MLPDRVSNPGPLTYESGALPIALRGPAEKERTTETEWIYMLCTLKGQTALHCLTNKGVRYPLFVIVLDVHTRLPGSQSA